MMPSHERGLGWDKSDAQHVYAALSHVACLKSGEGQYLSWKTQLMMPLTEYICCFVCSTKSRGMHHQGLPPIPELEYAVDDTLYGEGLAVGVEQLGHHLVHLPG
jgi:hypothetical protein